MNRKGVLLRPTTEGTGCNRFSHSPQSQIYAPRASEHFLGTLKYPVLRSKTFGFVVTQRCEQNKMLRFHGIARRAPDQLRAPALRPSLHRHRPSLPPLLLLILMRSAFTAAVPALVLTCHELHNRACGRKTNVLAAGLLAAGNVPLLQSEAFFRHSFNLNAEGSSGRPLEAGHFNVPI